MKKYIITIKNQIETFNIVGISEDALFHVMKAYYNKEMKVGLGGKQFPLRRILEIKIHEFENEDVVNLFIKSAEEKNLKKRSLTGDYYYDFETVSAFSKDVTEHYLKPEKDPVNTNSSQPDYSREESKEILKGIDEIIDRLSKLELGQQIIYDDLRNDLEEVKQLIGKTTKKTLRQLILGKLVDAGLGSLTGEVVDVIKDVDIKTLL